MPRVPKINDEMIKAAYDIVNKAKTAREIRIGLSIILPVTFNVTNKKTAEILGVKDDAIARMQKEIRDNVSIKEKDQNDLKDTRKKSSSTKKEVHFITPWTKG